MRVLLVEDDIALCDGLSRSLRDQGYALTSANTGKDALDALSTEEFSLLILDLGLPDIDGLQILKHAKLNLKGLFVLILTARDSINDKIDGLDAGADDYLPKPFDMQELFARIRAIERRASTATSALIQVQEVSLNLANHQLQHANNEHELPRREFMLLKSLMENVGRIQNKSHLEQQLYEWGEELSSNAIEVHISNLRKKLPTNFIKTVLGVGYMVPKHALNN